MRKLGNEKEDALLKELRNEGRTVYSISRINAYNTCAYQYYRTYGLKDRGISNPYSESGTISHDTIEEVYRSNIVDYKGFTQKLHTKFMELEIMGLDFPSEKIKESFQKDILHYANNFNKLDGEFTLEKMFISKVGQYYLMGYIDMIREHEAKVEVIDWKSSSKFAGAKKLQEAGRQLVLYKMGLEQTSNLKVDEVKWGMLKYVNVCWVQANKKVKKKMVNRGKLMTEMKKAFEKDLIKAGMDEIEVGMILLSAEESNDFNSLPQVLKDKYWLEDCYVTYDVTDELIQDVEDYVVSTIEEIESKDSLFEGDWEPVDFDKDGTFYCNNLCNHRQSCTFIKEYNKANPFKKGY